MADIYDQQFANRLAMHALVCDKVSADLLATLTRYFKRSQEINAELLQALEVIADAYRTRRLLAADELLSIAEAAIRKARSA